MGQVTFGMMCSLDGFVAGPEGGPSLPPPGTEMHQHFNDQMAETGVALYGRRMYQIMRYWDEEQSPDAPAVEKEFAEIWRRVPKVVVSSGRLELGPNARLLQGDLATEVRNLKETTAGDIDVAGPTLAASLSALGLIDLYRVYLMPLLLGDGLRFFLRELPRPLQLVETRTLPEGVVRLSYRPAKGI